MYPRDHKTMLHKYCIFKDIWSTFPKQYLTSFNKLQAYHVGLNAVLGWPQASRPKSKKNRHL